MFLKRSLEQSTSGSDKNKKKNRLYRNDYLKYGFTFISSKPQCVACCEVLPKESMKPSKLCRHLSNKHPQRKLNSFRKKQDTFTLSTIANEKSIISKLE